MAAMSAQPNGEVVVIPGKGGGQAGYPRLNEALEAEGLVVHSVVPDWTNGFFGALDDVARQVDERVVSPEAALLGHSLGAVLAMGEAARRAYGCVAFCSPTPTGRSLTTVRYDHLVQLREAMGPDTLAELSAIETDTWLIETQIPRNRVYVLLEAKNTYWDTMRRRAETVTLLLGAHLIQVANVGHHINDEPDYIATAVQVITNR